MKNDTRLPRGGVAGGPGIRRSLREAGDKWAAHRLVAAALLCRSCSIRAWCWASWVRMAMTRCPLTSLMQPARGLSQQVFPTMWREELDSRLRANPGVEGMLDIGRASLRDCSKRAA